MHAKLWEIPNKDSKITVRHQINDKQSRKHTTQGSKSSEKELRESVWRCHWSSEALGQKFCRVLIFLVIYFENFSVESQSGKYSGTNTNPIIWSPGNKIPVYTAKFADVHDYGCRFTPQCSESSLKPLKHAYNIVFQWSPIALWWGMGNKTNWIKLG